MLGGYHKQKYTIDKYSSSNCDLKRNQTLLQYVAKFIICVIIFWINLKQIYHGESGQAHIQQRLVIMNMNNLIIAHSLVCLLHVILN